MRLAPDDPRPPYALGMLLQHLGRLPEARTSFARVLAIDPDDPDAVRQRRPRLSRTAARKFLHGSGADIIDQADKVNERGCVLSVNTIMQGRKAFWYWGCIHRQQTNTHGNSSKRNDKCIKQCNENEPGREYMYVFLNIVKPTIWGKIQWKMMIIYTNCVKNNENCRNYEWSKLTETMYLLIHQKVIEDKGRIRDNKKDSLVKYMVKKLSVRQSKLFASVKTVQVIGKYEKGRSLNSYEINSVSTCEATVERLVDGCKKSNGRKILFHLDRSNNGKEDRSEAIIYIAYNKEQGDSGAIAVKRRHEGNKVHCVAFPVHNPLSIYSSINRQVMLLRNAENYHTKCGSRGCNSWVITILMKSNAKWQAKTNAPGEVKYKDHFYHIKMEIKYKILAYKRRSNIKTIKT